MPLLRPNTGMNTKLWSLKYTLNTATAVDEKAEQDLVHTEGHHRADGVENDGRRAHGVDVSDHRAVGAEAPEGWVDIVVAGEVEQHRQDGRHDLAQHGGGGSPPPPCGRGPGRR